MKKIFLLFAAFCAVQLSSAGNTIVIRSDSPNSKGKTEVTIEGDSIVITPQENTLYIDVCIRDIEGNIVSQDVICPNLNGVYVYNTHIFNNLYIIEIRNEHEVIYEDILL